MWRTIIARAPLPMLALAASYGVWSFNLLFVPWWVALIGAAAFEATYVGLAVARVSDHDRKRAGWIAASAVAVSVIYNVASGLFHRRPELLDAPPLWLDAALAVMHGLPLAVVAYAVASLLLHAKQPQADELHSTAPAPTAMPGLAYARLADQPQYPLPELANTDGVAGNTINAPVRVYTCRHCGDDGLTKAEQLAHGRQHKRERQ